MLHKKAMVKRRRTANESIIQADRTQASTHGREAAASWLTALKLQAVPRWHVEVTLETNPATRFNINVYAEEWGFAFHHDRRSSWIRVTDIPFVHGRDDFGLLVATPELDALNNFIAKLEAMHEIELPRSNAIVRSNIPNASRIVGRWLAEPLAASKKRNKTIDLCANEMHGGIRCIREAGHEGDHMSESGDGTLRWK